MSEMLPEEDALIEEILPDRPIATLRDIQSLYGSLNILSQGARGEYAAYLTPTEANGILGEPDSVIAVRIDLSDDEPCYNGIHLDTYREELIPLLAHSKYPAGNGVDHSVTHISGVDKPPHKLGDYAGQRLSRWASEETVIEVADSHENGDILRALAELGSNEAVISKIEADVESLLEGDRKALLTVQIRKSESGSWKWPGELDVFGAAMVELNTHRMSSKGEATDAKGTASDMLTGEEGTVVGTSNDPLSFYLTKQAGAFPNIDSDEAWRNHAIAAGTALRVSQAGPYLERCTTRAYRSKVYNLRYFTEMDVHRARILQELFIELDSEDAEQAPLQYIYEHAHDAGVEEDLRFAVIALIQEQMSLVTLLGHTMNNAGFVPADLAVAHETALEGPLFSGSAAPFDWYNGKNDEGYAKYPLAFPWHTESTETASNRLFADIARGHYFLRTFADRDFQQDPSPNDASIQAFLASFGGDPFPVSELLSEYTSRLIEEEDPGSFFPRQTITQQFTQYLALAECGLLSGDNELASASITKMTDMLTEPEPDASNAEKRAHTLEQFLESHPPLANAERRAIFLLGALIGHVDRYQRSPESNRSTTVLTMHPIKSMTKASLKRTLADVMNKTAVYSQESDYITSGLMYNEITSRLPEEFESSDPTDWDISIDDLRYHYALGVAYAHGSGRSNN